MPIYFILAESLPARSATYYIWRILKVFSCTTDDIQHLYDTEVRDFQSKGHNVNTFLFEREPANPFRVDVSRET